MKLSGWGRFPAAECRVTSPRSEAEVLRLIAAGPAIPRGNGRAYGDAAMNAGQTLSMLRMNRLIAFDDTSGQLIAEAGVMLSEVIDTFLPRGWFPVVTPGTRFVTLGGAIAADVHGKNHHKDGSFGTFVDWIDLACADGTVKRVSRKADKALFEWTLGGMGLTGVILRCALRLRRVESGWITQRTLPAANLAAAMEVFETSQDSTYSVAWIDCLKAGRALGRSLVMLGEHAALDDLPRERWSRPYDIGSGKTRRVPFDLPSFMLNPITAEAFNDLYYWNGRRRAGEVLTSWQSYFYPLDALLDWNRIYGRRGLAQFQCVLPLTAAYAGLNALLNAIAAQGGASFLAVLKRMGEQSGRFSFPMPGYTLALDFPANSANLALLERLDAIVLDHGGRFYLAKDSRMSAETFQQSDPRWQKFYASRDKGGMRAAFASLQSERLGL